MKAALAVLMVVVVALIAGCSTSDSGSDDDEGMTSAQVSNFMSGVKANVPYMRRFSSEDDFKELLEAICGSFEGGQSYGNISETTGAYIIKEPSSGVVDEVIRVAVIIGCPSFKDQTNA